MHMTECQVKVFVSMDESITCFPKQTNKTTQTHKTNKTTTKTTLVNKLVYVHKLLFFF